MSEFTLVPKIGEDGIVRTNAKELLQAIEPQLKKFDYVVTDDTLKDAKTDRASLNNLVKTIQSERKKIEDEVFGEWKKEKADIMALEKRLSASAEKLDAGIKQLEEKDKELKKKQIEEFWYTLTKKYPFELVFEKKMLNKTVTVKQIEDHLKKVLAKAIEGEHMMETFLPQDKFQAEQIKDVYYRTMDLAQAKAKADELARISQAVKTAEQLQPSHQQTFQEQPKAEEPVQEETKKAVTSSSPSGIYGATFAVEGTYDDMANLSKELVLLFKKYNITAKVEKKWKKV